MNYEQHKSFWWKFFVKGTKMKSNQVLFSVNSSGRLFGLETDQFQWRELPYLGIEFKKISSSKNSLWALGGDHQLYVRLFGVEVPIRVREVCEHSLMTSHKQGQGFGVRVDDFCDTVKVYCNTHFSLKEGV